MDSPEFVLSTVHPTTHEPRARYCIFRSLWGELPENERNPAERNQRVYESELLAFTTDKRMLKAGEICGVDGEVVEGSGGGGKVEAVFWVKGSVMVQWRVKGTGWVLGRDIDEEGGERVRRALEGRMRVVAKEGKEEWSWGREVTGHFGNMSPGMRGSFRNPPPGRFLCYVMLGRGSIGCIADCDALCRTTC